MRDFFLSFCLVLGDRILLGPQTFATVINVPEHNTVLAQMELVPGTFNEYFHFRFPFVVLGFTLVMLW